MKYHFCGCRAVLEEDMQPFGRQELDSNVLKSPLLERHIIHVTKLVLHNDDDDGKTNVRMLRAVLSPQNCGDIRLQYIIVYGRRGRTRNFTQSHFPNGGRTQVHELSQIHREIGVCILFINFAPRVAELCDVKMAVGRNLV